MDITELIKAGDKEAIKQVYKENSNEVYEFARSITGGHETALEATKQTFLAFFSRIQEGEHPANIRSSLLKLAHDEACKIAIPSSEDVSSPYDAKDSEIGELDAAVGNCETDEAMGETRVISLPKEAIDELVDDEDGKTVEEIAEEEYYDEPDDGYYDEYDDYYDEYEDDYDDEPRRSSGVFAVCLIICIIFILILIWFAVGLLEHMGIIPEINLGYEWFNAHIADIF